MIEYLLCWFLLAAVGVANGTLRQYTYGRRLSELAAHQVSTFTAIVLTGLLVWGVSSLWPLASIGQAWLVGAVWLAATMAFEFGFGHYVVGHSWEKLLRDYNLRQGRLWLLVLVWTLVMPPLFHTLS
ncbi:hypothetical protein [Wenzhouxiangella sediminis]|uniref:Uncharacterized protein n=1 Tax=Wenzhouxiangella sediminis TaxID=1792836 RepID=A0A3E1K694_9GAMM|nr:hypothetical protein [Wenzhouxiangella sediminis]RFF29488.1 hypothetical protein DZC52_12660 [Wenzhouxiangella sediminis]